MTKELVILGAGGFAREASLLVEEISYAHKDSEQWSLLGYIDEDESKWGQKLRGYPVLGGWQTLAGLPDNIYVICVIGDPAAKKRMVEKAEAQGRKFATLVCPEVKLSGDIKIGKGVLLNKGSLLTVDIEIGDHVSLNPGCGIGHDSKIGHFTTLFWRVNISGNVHVGEGCLLGTGSTILQNIKIGTGATVGAGAVVTKDLPENCRAVGVPARVV